MKPYLRPIEALFVLPLPEFEGLYTHIKFVGTSCYKQQKLLKGKDPKGESKHSIV